MQIAVVLPDEMVDDLDRLVPIQFRSRAEAVRHAVQRLLAAEHEAAVDRRYVEAYKISPPGIDEIDAARARAIPKGWEELAW